MNPESVDSEQHSRVSCVFVHGWAMNSAAWDPCVEHLPDWIDAIFVDLPGHGSMNAVSADSLDDYVKAVVAVVNRPVIWVGWSMGGLVTMQIAARHPERVAGLFQVATSPCFVQSSGWQTAIEADIFDQFARFLSKDMEQTIKRFLALQVMGSENAKQTMGQLQHALLERGLPDRPTLESGLRVLQETDLREQLAHLIMPTRWLLGEMDTLVPRSLQTSLEQLNPYIEVVTQAHAGHAPFISHPAEFAASLGDFAARFLE